jgi:hypothetical protein
MIYMVQTKKTRNHKAKSQLHQWPSSLARKTEDIAMAMTRPGFLMFASGGDQLIPLEKPWQFTGWELNICDIHVKK